MNSFILQIGAMLTMLIDHIGYLYFQSGSVENFYLRSIGRFAFVIYAFLLANAFYYLKNDGARLKKHLIFYLFLCVISEVAYDIFMFKKAIETSQQNVVFTLLIGFIAIYTIENTKSFVKAFIIVILAMGATHFLQSEYKISGIFLIVSFYYYIRNSNNLNYAKRLLLLFAIIAVFVAINQSMIIWTATSILNSQALIIGLKMWHLTYYPFYFLTPFFLALYNGKLGYQNKNFKIFYKYFYPMHLLMLVLISIK